MATETPQCKCRCCAHTMDAVWQPPPLPGREGMWLVTCVEKGCNMRMYTFSLRNYPHVKLEDYLPCKAIG